MKYITFLVMIITAVYLLINPTYSIDVQDKVDHHVRFFKKDFVIDKNDVKGILTEYFKIEKSPEYSKESLVYARFKDKLKDWDTKEIPGITATAYYPGPESCGEYADGYTFMEMVADYGIIAVDPRVIELGSVVYVENYGFAIAADIGGAIKGNKIDLCFPEYNTAMEFGVERLNVAMIPIN